MITGDDEEEVERALERVLVPQSCGNGITMDEAILKEWTTEVQMKRLLAAVHG